MAKKVSNRNKSASRVVYEPLPTGWIRLLKLKPGTIQRLDCSLELVELSEVTTYGFEALSYVWGSEYYTYVIWLHCHEFHVTRNLHNALVALRDDHCERWLWVDAICINQTDSTEKSIQIGMMTKIYQAASKVVAWLGQDGGGLEPAFSLIGAATESDVKNKLRALVKYDIRWTHQALKAIVDCEYWYRGWIVQEIASARQLFIYCGKKVFSYESLEWALEQLPMVINITSTAGSEPASALSRPQFPKRILRREDLDDGIVCLDFYLDSLLDRRCSQPLDYVFAFCGLFPEQTRSRITPGYGSKPDKILLQAITGIIDYTDSLKVLGTRSRQKLPDSREYAWQRRTPSWCPYVGAAFVQHSMATLQKMPDVNVVTEKPRFDETTRTLHIFGLTIGTIPEMTAECMHDLPGQRKAGSDEHNVKIMEQHRDTWNNLGLRLPECHGRCDDNSLSCGTTGVRAHEPEALLELNCYWGHIKGKTCCTVTDDSCNSGSRLGMVALVPRVARTGDKICWFKGCPVPIILRGLNQSGSGDKFLVVVGEAYVEDLEKWKFTKELEQFILK